MIKWFPTSVSVDFGSLACSNYTWGNGAVTSITMPSGFTTQGLKAFILSEAIGDNAQNRATDIIPPGVTSVHTWINAKGTSGWYIKNIAYRVYIDGDRIGAGASYFGIDLEGSYNTTNLKVWNVNEFHAQLWIKGAIYSN